MTHEQELESEVQGLRAAIQRHYNERGDDRCWMDDDKLYAAAGLPPCDRRVGNKEEMLANCARFIERRCEEGGWPTYRELEEQVNQLNDDLAFMGVSRNEEGELVISMKTYNYFLKLKAESKMLEEINELRKQLLLPPYEN